MLVILTRWHDDDLAGRLLKKMAEGEGDEWVVVEYPAQAVNDELFRKAGEPLHDLKDRKALKPSLAPTKALQEQKTRAKIDKATRAAPAMPKSAAEEDYSAFDIYTATPEEFAALPKSVQDRLLGNTI